MERYSRDLLEWVMDEPPKTKRLGGAVSAIF